MQVPQIDPRNYGSNLVMPRTLGDSRTHTNNPSNATSPFKEKYLAGWPSESVSARGDPRQGVLDSLNVSPDSKQVTGEWPQRNQQLGQVLPTV